MQTACWHTCASTISGIRMTNFVALMVGIFIVAAIVIDMVLFGPDHMIFLLRRMEELIEWLAFWR